ncbi:ribonuclease E inhibitor RraB [Roseateles sp. So40a]|uniref:ribonuclease E inhibitor RraB n=1 Tax=Roseateles sp. So40a TaxID=3400226 RepID=UPI003A847EA9
MIELEQLEEMFAGIAAGPNWDMSKPMLWGHFFTDERREKLEGALPELAKKGCRFVDLYQPEINDGEAPYFFLHVECEEVHSPESLLARNAEFYALAEDLGLGSYDGMDVGPVIGIS